MQDIAGKIKALEKVLKKCSEIRTQDSSDPTFKSWKNLCERTLHNIYGDKSKEFEQFSQLAFFYNPGVWFMGQDYSQENRQAFVRDLEVAKKLLLELIEEQNGLPTTDEPQDNHPKAEPSVRIFISHSSLDKAVVEELIDILESMGLLPSQIFCSSFEGYGIPLGSNFLETIKTEISQQVLVLFVLTKNFFDSTNCVCEMGATWVLSKDHIPIVVPPFGFKEIEGFLPNSQGLAINDELKLNMLRDKIVKDFSLDQQPMAAWERKRDRALSRLNALIGIL